MLGTRGRHGDQNAAWCMVSQAGADRAAPPTSQPRVFPLVAHDNEVALQLGGKPADFRHRFADREVPRDRITTLRKCSKSLGKNILHELLGLSASLLRDGALEAFNKH